MNYSIPLKYYIVISIIVMSIESFLCIFYGKYYFRGWHNAEIEDIIFHVIVTISLIYYYKKNTGNNKFTNSLFVYQNKK